ncbi:MAG: ATP-binding protein [Alphaproteobacteria bacterium]|nr:ATP-binding protein [Alphaproteobacteria bacterium]
MLNFLGNRKPDESFVRSALAELEGCVTESVIIEGGHVTAVLDIAQATQKQDIQHEAEKRLLRLKGVSRATVILTAERKGSAHNPHGKKPSGFLEMPVKNIIAVASGKGGVGKSTLAINLAAGLSKLGYRTGVLDADIYGPSLPRLAGMRDVTPERVDEKIIPIEAHGLKLMSMGFLVNEASPMIWRGPMVQSALVQLLRDVDWSNLDVLVLDLPPGTGDIQLTLAQKVQLTGAVIVSTPQDIALIDAHKGLEMFRKTNVPVLGIVENMSYFCCPQCNTRTDIFGHGGAKEEAAKAGVPFLGEVPLHASIRTQSDAGVPIVIAEPESHQARAFMDVARAVGAHVVAK